MSKPKPKPQKTLKVVALHDLSYVDPTTKEPQYRRQSSIPFDMDEGNVKQFLERKAIKVFEEAAAVADDFTDDFADDEAEKAAAAEAEKAAADAAAEAEKAAADAAKPAADPKSNTLSLNKGNSK